jgi:hypothetical protein
MAVEAGMRDEVKAHKPQLEDLKRINDHVVDRLSHPPAHIAKPRALIKARSAR